jgi:hypothetical protein
MLFFIVVKPDPRVNPTKNLGPRFYGSTHKTQVIYGVKWLKKEMESKAIIKR